MLKKKVFDYKIIFLAYRDWAKNVIFELKKKIHFKNIHEFKNNKKFEKFIKNKSGYLIIVIGWSEILNSTIIKKNNCLGVHPSDLPDFKGGSPIQHQIKKNIQITKNSLYKLENKIDSGEIIGKERLSLKGDNFYIISKNIKKSSFKLIFKYLKKYPNNKKLTIRKRNNKILKRLQPKDSQIKEKELMRMSTIEIYNKIRCLTYPYPNAYTKDINGNKLFFKEVAFKNK